MVLGTGVEFVGFPIAILKSASAAADSFETMEWLEFPFCSFLVLWSRSTD
jgi:hypothetical protein